MKGNEGKRMKNKLEPEIVDSIVKMHDSFAKIKECEYWREIIRSNGGKSMLLKIKDFEERIKILAKAFFV